MKPITTIEVGDSDDSVSSFTEYLIGTRERDDLNTIYEDIEDVKKIEVQGHILYNEDIRRLLPNKWLNDKIINAYMELLSYTYKDMHCFSTYIYPKLSYDNFDKIAEWFRGVDIFSYEFIVIPIHEAVHWTLMIVTNGVIEYYDSLGNINEKALRLVKSFFGRLCFLRNRIKIEYKIRVMMGRFGLQQNGDDCGVFCCMLAKYRISPHLHVVFDTSEINTLRRRMLHELLAGQIIY